MLSLVCVLGGNEVLFTLEHKLSYTYPLYCRLLRMDWDLWDSLGKGEADLRLRSSNSSEEFSDSLLISPMLAMPPSSSDMTSSILSCEYSLLVADFGGKCFPLSLNRHVRQVTCLPTLTSMLRTTRLGGVQLWLACVMIRTLLLLPQQRPLGT